MKTIVFPFFAGIREFRSNAGRTYNNPFTLQSRAYDYGRELAHLITFRRFES